MRYRLLIFSVLTLGAALPLVSQAGSAEEQLEARDEFRWGVESLHDGKVNEAIASLSRSLSLNSSELLTRYWLGRAYYYGGFEDAALQEWTWMRDRGPQSAVLRNWIERLRVDRGLTGERLGSEVAPGRHVPLVSIPGIQDDFVVFHRPTMVRPRPDGWFYVASFGTHAVVLLDPNGVRQSVIDGGIEGFDRPFDVLPLENGGLLVSEFGANRIARVSPNGIKTGTFGSGARSQGGLLGPQFMTSDDGFLYVTDYGNSRIAKFTLDGEFLFSFGERGRGFDGLQAPAGIVVDADRVYVSDNERGTIVVFDTSGNVLGELQNRLMQQPEGISLYGPGRILVSDSNRLYVIEVGSERVFSVNDSAAQKQFLGAAVDANGNVLAADYAGSEIVVLAPNEELYRGLTVEIDSVEGNDHPFVYVSISVTDRNGRPMLGLDEENFRITEDRFPTGAFELMNAGYLFDEAAVALVVDRSRGLLGQEAAIREAALAVANGMHPDDRLWLVSAGQTPVIEHEPGSGALAVARSAVGDPSAYGRSELGTAIRLAGTQIIREPGTRSLVMISNGAIDPGAFDVYGLQETAEFLGNNHIGFSVIYTARNQRSAELDFLVEATNGESAYLYRPEGIAGLVGNVRSRPNGRYLLRYQSVHDSDFGRRYIPVEVETYLLTRSGRDEAGYFGPLEF